MVKTNWYCLFSSLWQKPLHYLLSMLCKNQNVPFKKVFSTWKSFSTIILLTINQRLSVFSFKCSDTYLTLLLTIDLRSFKKWFSNLGYARHTVRVLTHCQFCALSCFQLKHHQLSTMAPFHKLWYHFTSYFPYTTS